MKEVGIFNINETKKSTNQDLSIIFSPSKNVKQFILEIYKNNEKIEESNQENILLEETGIYKIKVTAEMNDGSIKTSESGSYVIDKEAPSINMKKPTMKINIKDLDKIKENIEVKDNYDQKVKVKIGKIDTRKRIQTIECTAKDEAGNIAKRNIDITFNNNYTAFTIVYGIIITSFVLLIYLIAKYKKAINIESRLNPYTVKPIKNTDESLSEKLIKKYKTLTKRISKSFDKSEIAKKYSDRLEKYSPITNLHSSGKDIFAGKIIVSFIFTLIAVITKTLTFKMISGYELILVFTFGFFVLDLLYFIKYKMFRWKIESDFIAAITIMNNAFKSGRSITQSIDIVAEELKGPIGEEFHRMSLEILYGLEIDTVFERFAKRINLEEANYLTASLTILNKTGGDIIKVFNLIEKNMFDKRKLRLELSSLTSGSKIVVATLLGMPFFFALVISMINKNYFIPLVTTNIGRLLLLFMIIYYIIFVVIVRKIMKVVI